MRLETDEAFDPDRSFAAPTLTPRSASGDRPLALLCSNELHHLPRKSRSASGGGPDHIAGRIGAAGVAASGVERALSGSRLRAICELGARERPCWARPGGAHAR